MFFNAIATARYWIGNSRIAYFISFDVDYILFITLLVVIKINVVYYLYPKAVILFINLLL